MGRGFITGALRIIDRENEVDKSYLNGATAQLAQDIRALIDLRPDLSSDVALNESFTRFE